MEEAVDRGAVSILMLMDRLLKKDATIIQIDRFDTKFCFPRLSEIVKFFFSITKFGVGRFKCDDVKERKKWVQLVETVKGMNCEVLVYSSKHVTGEALEKGFGGLAALLRYPCPDILEIEQVIPKEPEKEKTASPQQAPRAKPKPKPKASQKTGYPAGEWKGLTKIFLF